MDGISIWTEMLLSQKYNTRINIAKTKLQYMVYKKLKFKIKHFAKRDEKIFIPGLTKHIK